MSSTLELLSQTFASANAISRAEFRKFMGVSPATDWRAWKAGNYPRLIKLGTHERILLVDLAAFLDAGGSSSSRKKQGRPVGSKNKPKTHAA